MVRIYKAIALDGEVSLELDTGFRLFGSVAWAHEWDFGIAFATPVDVDAVLGGRSPGGPGENRRALPRTPISCPAQLRLPSRILKARIKNISPAGASVETLRPLEMGARVTLTLPDLPPMAGTVRWSNESSAGMRFDEPLPPDVLNGWLTERGR